MCLATPRLKIFSIRFIKSNQSDTKEMTIEGLDIMLCRPENINIGWVGLPRSILVFSG